jgi:hypothetical protein
MFHYFLRKICLNRVLLVVLDDICKFNDIKFNDIEFNDIKFNDIKFNDIKFNEDITRHFFLSLRG